MERSLVEYLEFSSEINFGLSGMATRKLAYEFAAKKKLRMPPRWEKTCMAGIDWLKGFMKRWPQLSLRKPQATSVARASAFNRVSGAEFFLEPGAGDRPQQNKCEGHLERRRNGNHHSSNAPARALAQGIQTSEWHDVGRAWSTGDCHGGYQCHRNVDPAALHVPQSGFQGPFPQWCSCRIGWNCKSLGVDERGRLHPLPSASPSACSVLQRVAMPHRAGQPFLARQSGCHFLLQE